MPDAVMLNSASETRSLEELHAAIRETYFIEHRRFYEKLGQHSTTRGERHIACWDGGETADGKFHKPVWPQLASFAMKHGVSPFDLIRAAFQGWSGLQPPPPTRIYSEWGRALAVDWQKVLHDDIAFELQSNGNRAMTYYYTFKRRGHTDVEAWREVVYGYETDLSALYRCCMACNANFDDLIERYEDRALTTYVWSQDAYDKVWGSWIPDRLRDKAKQLRSSFR